MIAKIAALPGRVVASLVCFTISLTLQSLAQGASSTNLLAYEGFNYNAGSGLTGQDGGVGWSGGWLDIGGGSGETVRSGSLLSAGRAMAGLDNRSAGNSVFVSNGNRCGRWLDCTSTGTFSQAGYLNTNGIIGAPGKTLYVSFLQQASSAAQFYEFEFHRGDLGDPGRIGGIGNDMANAVTVNLRAPNSVQTPFELGNTNVNFYVVRIDFHGGNDDVYVYTNPTGQSEADNSPALTMLSAADMSFNGISTAAYLNGVSVSHDEIRLGQTWASALGNPPAFVLQPTNQNLYVGQTFSLDSVAQATQSLTYQWYRIADGSTNLLSDETNASLAFANVAPGDAGEYFVTASNALGSATSAMARLTVQTISMALTSPANSAVRSDGDLDFDATVGGAEPLSLQWYKDGSAVAGATSTNFTPGGTDAAVVGQYWLVASNAYGSVTSSVVSVYSRFGGLLAYEGFNYAPAMGDIGGANGGFGWAGAWVNVDGNSSTFYSTNLVAGTNAPAGFDQHSLAGYLFQPNSSRKGRFLDCTANGTFAQHGYLDDNGNVGRDGSTIYISFLQQPSALVQFYEFEIKRGDLGDGGRVGGIGNDTLDTDVHLRIESPAGGSSTFYDLGPGNTNVNFYVLRIDYHNGNDTVMVYRNPTSLTEPATATVVVSNVPDMSFNGISIGAYLNGVNVSHDEVRMGMTWADVVGQTMSQLQIARGTNGTSNLLLAASPNFIYGVQVATNLMGPWTNIGTVTASSLGNGQFTETNGSDRQRFYRATNGAIWSGSPSNGGVFADFEASNYGAWSATGNAFGSGPAQGSLPGQQSVSGYEGSGLVNSYLGGDGSTGTLTSPPFVITKRYIDFLIGGGNHPGLECMNLVVSNAVVATATGANSETLAAQQWDVSAYIGQTAQLQIVDSISATGTGVWGHILADEIVFTDEAFTSLTRTLLLTNNLLNFPAKNGAPLKRVTVTVNGSAVRDFKMALADGKPDWWAFLDVSEFSNQVATISVDSLNPGSTALSSVVQSNGIMGATNLYAESLRPQLHFSARRGWLNDANGMVYAGGQYHLYYQHDPFNWAGNDQKYWGHAVSKDMVNWTEVQEAIYPHSYGDWVWSGSAVVDTNNAGGFKTGTNDVIVAAFYSTARGECIAYSVDGGLSFIDYSNNPVAVHSGQGRDPHLFWYAPSNYWVMAVYDDSGGNGIQFYSTPDFHHWTFRSKIYNGFYECPDMFQLPVDGNTNSMMWELNDGSSGYMLGQFNGATFTPATAELPGNSGASFYASQTFTSMAPGDKRVVRIGWATISLPGMPFNEMMYFPTELNLRTTANGVRLCSTPAAEITNNAVNVYAWTNLTLAPGYNPFSGIRGGLFDVRAQFSPGTAQAITFTFQNVTVTYNGSAQQLTCNGNTQSLPAINGSVQLEIISDRDTIEIFGNNGQLYMPMPANNASGNSLISLTCSGGNCAFSSLTVNKLKSIWTAF